MLTAIFLAAAVATAPAPGLEAVPTPERIFAAAKVPFGTIVSAYNVKQEFRAQDDGTFLGVVLPTFEEQQKTTVWAKEHVENLVGPWDSVTRRVGSIRNTEGKLVSMDEALQIAPAARAPYLVVSSIDSTAKPGKKTCVASVIGVWTTTEEPQQLKSRPYGTLTGCGLTKETLTVAKPDFSITKDPDLAWKLAQDQMLKAMADELGIKLYTNTITLKPANTTEENGGNNE